jgi:hypothetical protein
MPHVLVGRDGVGWQELEFALAISGAVDVSQFCTCDLPSNAKA